MILQNLRDRFLARIGTSKERQSDIESLGDLERLYLRDAAFFWDDVGVLNRG